MNESTELTDAEKITLCTCRKGDCAEQCLQRIAAVERILADRAASTGQDDGLRAAVENAVDGRWDHSWNCSAHDPEGNCDCWLGFLAAAWTEASNKLAPALDAAPAFTDNPDGPQ